MPPTRVSRGSSRILNSAPLASLSSSRSAWRSSASVCIVRNFRHGNGRWPIPWRVERNRIGPREESRTASAIASSSGLSSTSSSSAPTRSNVRFSAKSTPSNAGGPSSNSGTDWPGTNSARWIRISIVDGARRTRTPRWWHWSTSSTASTCGKSGSAMITSSIRSEPSTRSRSVERAERVQPVAGQRRRREEADDLDRRVRRVGERVADVGDVLARPDDHRAAAIAGGAQDHAGQPLVPGAQRRDVQQREASEP